MPFFVIFVIIPLIEIALFMAVGDEIGILPTLLLCVLTAMVGAVLLRLQGLAVLLSLRREMAQGGMPLRDLFDGVCLALAGVMLMTPGFFTDAMGFALLVPGVRARLRRRAARYFGVPEEFTAAPNGAIDAEFERLDDSDEI